MNSTQLTPLKIFGLISKYGRLTFVSISFLTIAACSENDGSTSTSDTESDNPPLGSNVPQQFAFVAGLVPNTDTRRIDRLLIDNDTISIDGSFPSIASDISLATDGEFLYQLGQTGTDNITQFNPADTSSFNYQFSVNAEGESEANPQRLAFIDETKAYLTRRGSDDLWIVNPTPSANENFRLSTIDLDAYDTDLPNMTDAIIVDDKLFVLMERVQELPDGAEVADKNGFIAVFNTLTDTEIDTNQSTSDLKGIELLVSQPSALQYNTETAEIYIVGRGNFLENNPAESDYYNGGIEAIDPTTYQHTLLLDDGSSENNSGYFFDLEVINSELAFLVTYEDADNKTLRSFNPTTGILNAETFSLLESRDITCLAIGPDNHLWVGINEPGSPGIYRINVQSGELAPEKIATEVIPMDITFIQVGASN